MKRSWWRSSLEIQQSRCDDGWDDNASDATIHLFAVAVVEVGLGLAEGRKKGIDVSVFL